MHRIAKYKGRQAGNKDSENERPVASEPERRRDRKDKADKLDGNLKGEFLFQLQLLSEFNQADILEPFEDTCDGDGTSLGSPYSCAAGYANSAITAADANPRIAPIVQAVSYSARPASCL